MNMTVRPHAAVMDPDDIGHNTTDTPSFDALIAARLSRRNLFRLGVGSAASAMMLSACGVFFERVFDAFSHHAKACGVKVFQRLADVQDKRGEVGLGELDFTDAG